MADESSYQKGLRLLRENQFDAAFVELERAAVNDPKALGDLAYAQYQLGHLSASAATLHRYLEHFPTDPAAIELLIVCCLGQGNTQEAARFCHMLVGLAPTDENVLKMADLYRRNGQWREALRGYGDLIRRRPHDPLLHMRAAYCRRQKRNRLFRRLAQWGPVRQILRRLAASQTVMALFESACFDRGFLFHLRWMHSLGQGSDLADFGLSTPALSPDRFAEHFAQCQCPFWRWFKRVAPNHNIRLVLDVGCGRGSQTHHFLAEKFNVVGITCNEEEQRECRKRGITVRGEDFHFLSDCDATYDLVFASNSLEHSISPLFALWEWKRVLKPGGLLFIEAPLPIEGNCEAHYRHLSAPAVGCPDLSDTSCRPGGDQGAAFFYSYGVRTHVFVLSYWQLRWLFRQAGLELLASAVGSFFTGQVTDIGKEDVAVFTDDTPRFGLFLLQKSKPRFENNPFPTGGRVLR